jgi:hypothetical protein
MPARRKSPHHADIVPDQCCDKVVAILAAGLGRLIRAAEPIDTAVESAETGLELSRETRLSVSAG